MSKIQCTTGTNKGYYILMKGYSQIKLTQSCLILAAKKTFLVYDFVVNTVWSETINLHSNICVVGKHKEQKRTCYQLLKQTHPADVPTCVSMAQIICLHAQLFNERVALGGR